MSYLVIDCDNDRLSKKARPEPDMKPNHFFLLSAFGLALCWSAPVASAQDSLGPAGPAPKSAARGDGAPPKIEKISTLAVPDSELWEAIKLVQDKSQQPINVVFSGNAREQRVPSLTLRNVTGPDALMLIAAAANVQVQPIRGVEGGTIGFQFSERPKLSSRGGGGTTPLTQVDTSSNPYGSPLTNALYSGGSGAPKPAEDSAVTTRVYPLAEITSFVKFDEVEATLRDLLKIESISADAAKLAFHQKTAVLVARAPEEVHRLVRDLLLALTQNNREAREMNATRELASMRIELEAMVREKARLEDRVAEAETQARKYSEEMRILQGTPPDKK